MEFLHHELITFLVVAAIPITLLLSLKDPRQADPWLMLIVYGTGWIGLGTFFDYIEHLSVLGTVAQWLSQPFWDWALPLVFFGPGIVLALVGLIKWFPGAIRLQAEMEERRRVEAELNALNTTLRQTVQQLEEASKAKSAFLASMSHELRTPLNAVLGYGQMLELETAGPLTEAQRGYVTSILTGGRHLLTLVNDILDLACAESDELTLTLDTVDAREIVSRSLSMTRSLVEQRGLTVEDRFSDGPEATLHADPTRLTQVLLNLLSNAVKYNRDGGRVTIDGGPTDEGFLRLNVADTGIGIAPDNHAHVFEKFHRADHDPHLADEGSGIGLSVAKLLVEKMGGRIGFESSPGEGSIFWIEMPQVARPGAAPAGGTIPFR